MADILLHPNLSTPDSLFASYSTLSILFSKPISASVTVVTDGTSLNSNSSHPCPWSLMKTGRRQGVYSVHIINSDKDYGNRCKLYCDLGRYSYPVHVTYLFLSTVGLPKRSPFDPIT